MAALKFVPSSVQFVTFAISDLTQNGILQQRIHNNNSSVQLHHDNDNAPAFVSFNTSSIDTNMKITYYTHCITCLYTCNRDEHNSISF